MGQRHRGHLAARLRKLNAQSHPQATSERSTRKPFARDHACSGPRILTLPDKEWADSYSTRSDRRQFLRLLAEFREIATGWGWSEVCRQEDGRDELVVRTEHWVPVMGGGSGWEPVNLQAATGPSGEDIIRALQLEGSPQFDDHDLVESIVLYEGRPSGSTDSEGWTTVGWDVGLSIVILRDGRSASCNSPGFNGPHAPIHALERSMLFHLRHRSSRPDTE